MRDFEPCDLIYYSFFTEHRQISLKNPSYHGILKEYMFAIKLPMGLNKEDKEAWKHIRESLLNLW